MTEPPQPNPDYFEEYSRWLRTKGRAENTIKAYFSALRHIPKDVEGFFENRNMKGAKMKSVAYRSYLRFLAIKKDEIDRNDLMVFLDQFKPPKKRGNGINEDLWSIPKDKWVDYIRHAPNQVAKMGIYLGFHFGLRLGEIMHLQIQDVDFRTKNIHIKIQRKTNNQEAWNPKYNKERPLPFTKKQEKTLKKWINEVRPKNLPHNYLLWTLRGKRKNLRVDEKCFWRWCRITGKELDSRKFKPHILRYSFATHYYENSMDIKLISDLLGHADVKTTSDYLRLGQKETEDKARDLFNRA
jgi:integrase